MNRPLTHLRSWLLCLGMAALALPAAAEDIDIYSGTSSNSLPNVLLILDSSANWSSNITVERCDYRENGEVTDGDGPVEQSKKMGIEQCALYNLIDALEVDNTRPPNSDAKFNVGLMLLNESPNAGAYPRIKFTEVTTNAKAGLKSKIRELDITGDKGSNADFAKAMYEAYLYFRGEEPYMGTAGPEATDSTSGWDSDAVSNGMYVSPSAGSCARNYVIFIANGAPEGSENNDALALLTAANGGVAPSRIEYSPDDNVSSKDQKNWADEFSKFMRIADVSGMVDGQGIVTHTVAVTGASSDGNYPNFIKGIADASSGTYHEVKTANVLLDELLSIFDRLQPVNSVFASASLPVSVNARGTYLNQVYMGMFRPDADSKPRWRGNLKQYKFGLNGSQLRLVDSADAPAVTSGSGFISNTAISYWTEESTFWSNQQLGTPPSASDLPDGEVVEKGAGAQRLRTVYAASQDGRKVLTCVGCAANSTLGATDATEFKTSNALVTDTLLGVPSASRDALIDWVRGTDNAGDEAGPGPATTIRPSVHGDVLHSRPAVVNYGGSTGVVVFYGANDGMLHAINGNQSSEDDANAGNELWSFVPQELFGKLNRLRANSPIVRLSTTLSPDATPRDYFVDGPVGVYQKLNADLSVNRVIIYVAMRRGGRLLYALDVTNPTAPRYLWKKTSSDLAQLGQTWSEPKVARIRGNTDPVVVFGGGYDAAAEDSAPPGATTMGHRVYVLDAFSGAELKAFPTDRSVAADVTLVDSDTDGYIDRGYTVDLGGKVYRLDFETTTSQAVDDWSIHTVADLSGGTDTGRKFFFAPDAVVTRSFTALMFGSGDREKPLLDTTQDHFFQIFDTHLTKGAPEGYTATVWDDLTATGDTSSIAGRGCYVALETGEKVVNAAATIGGSSYFGTNRPSSAVVLGNVCSANLGVAKSYAMPLFCVTPTFITLEGGGLPPSPVAGIVTIENEDGEPEKLPFCIGCPNDKKSGIEASRINPLIDVPRRRLYWYQETNR